MSINTPALRATEVKQHPLQHCFHNLAEYSPDKALGALTEAVHAEKRGMNAYDWVQEALPGAELKPAFAFGTVGELYRNYSRGQEYNRFKQTLRS
ncbi:hypothetical protein F6X40_09440 [Paraburkholderia sp. UCT31]|uniref:hypothetical protein n=1 Tax=Paraburkholderia sp. UCT31 TaxID=2615209 RepID=UPI001654E5A1|nr:hypothetical protein [Paraburkholderia sp. UCT31]MBC8737031.1 hypothetical protein [Paraburkholderia sp. UCT31]